MDNSTDNQKQKRFADGGGKFVVPTGRSSNFLIEDLNSVFARIA